MRKALVRKGFAFAMLMAFVLAMAWTPVQAAEKRVVDVNAKMEKALAPVAHGAAYVFLAPFKIFEAAIQVVNGQSKDAAETVGQVALIPANLTYEAGVNGATLAANDIKYGGPANEPIKVNGKSLASAAPQGIRPTEMAAASTKTNSTYK